MAKRVRDTNLETRAGRSKLKARGKPYYKVIGEGLHLGYRKGKLEGKWVVRRYAGNQAYITDTIGTADDIADADGTVVLTFWQAQEKARATGNKMVYAGPYRVKDAIADYLVYLGGRGWGIEGQCQKHILAHLIGDIQLDLLDADTLSAWHRGLVSDKKDRRASQSSANRILVTLKAALNLAFKRAKVASDAAWKRVDKFKGVDISRDRYLSLEEVDRFLNACAPHFRKLARGALETGARYGELRALVVGDYNKDVGTIHVRRSKTGRKRHIILTDDGRAYFDSLTAGQPKSAPMFGHQWERDRQAHWMRLAVKAARIDPPISFHGLRHTWASHAVMNGIPLMVVSQNLGHVDTRMVEKHYGHLAPGYVVDQIREKAPRFGRVDSKIKSLR
jgi:integrase